MPQKTDKYDTQGKINENDHAASAGKKEKEEDKPDAAKEEQPLNRKKDSENDG